MWNLSRRMRIAYLPNRKRLTDIENELTESSTDIYTYIYIHV